jgi:hypothetical protein
VSTLCIDTGQKPPDGLSAAHIREFSIEQTHLKSGIVSYRIEDTTVQAPALSMDIARDQECEKKNDSKVHHNTNLGGAVMDK